MRYIFLSLLMGAFFMPAYADTVTYKFTPSKVREDGSPITGNTHFKVKACYSVYEGEEPQFTHELESGVKYEFQMIQYEDLTPSKIFTRSILIE